MVFHLRSCAALAPSGRPRVFIALLQESRARTRPAGADVDRAEPVPGDVRFRVELLGGQRLCRRAQVPSF